MIFQAIPIRGESMFRNKKLQRELFSEYPDKASLVVDNSRLFRNAGENMNYMI